MSVFKAVYPNARSLEPVVKGRSGIPTIAWRKMFGGQRLILSMPKALAAEMGFSFVAGSKNYAECAYVAQEGKLLVANVSNREDSTNRWTIQNRQNTMTLTIKPDWLSADTPSRPAQGCRFRVEEYQTGRILVLDLPDWAAPERVDYLAARKRGVMAAEDAATKLRANDPSPPGFSMISQRGS